MALNKFDTNWQAEIEAWFNLRPYELTSDACFENYRYYDDNLEINRVIMTDEEIECASMLRVFYLTQFEWLKRIGR